MTEDIKCPHEDCIDYGKLYQLDGEPQYEVTCQSCGAKGVIMLEEGENIWEAQDD